MTSFTLSPSLVEKVKLKLHFVDYDDYITIPDTIIEQHLQTAKTILEPYLTDETDISLFEECITELAKYFAMISWAANAIDTEKTPSAWNIVLKNELNILKTLLLRLIGDEIVVNQILGIEDIPKIAIPYVTNSGNLVSRFWWVK